MTARSAGWALLLVAACAAAPPNASTKVSGARGLTAGPVGQVAGDEGASDAARAAGAVSAHPPVQSSPRLPASLRVGLATDLGSITVPCCPRNLAARFDGQEIAVGEGLRIEPAQRRSSETVFRLQVAALQDERQAEALAARLEQILAEPADVVFRADDGFYRVRVGRFASREQAELARQILRDHDLEGSWVASEQSESDSPGLRLVLGEREWLTPGRWVELRAQSGGGIPILDRRYRGDVLVFLNERGTLNLINRVSVDGYLRGVVPREMGPAVYNNLDALKAQAVAARTYTLRNLGEFSSEGYDICATPRCQVYGGMAAEHELSDRAVLETSGQVLIYQGALADALYSAACGGHTENVEVVFPLKLHPYLRGVPCMEAGARTLGRAIDGNRRLEAEVVAAALGRGGRPRSPGEFAARAKALATMAGRSGASSELVSFDRRQVRRFLAGLVAPADRGTVAAAWLPELEPGAERAAGELRPGEADSVLLRLAMFLGVVEERELSFLAASGGRLKMRGPEGDRMFPLAELPATYNADSAGPRPGPIELMPGDRLTVFSSGDRLLALVRGGDPKPRAAEAHWRRGKGSRPWKLFRADRELAALIGQRYPQLGFAGLEIRSRGVSGRVAELRILGSGGQSVDVSGLPIRWTLDLPDTLFTARRLESDGREAGWQFKGRGWGHGVGMCQVGAFGMALRGHEYRDILDHYYTGLEIVELSSGPPDRFRQARMLDNHVPLLETE